MNDTDGMLGSGTGTVPPFIVVCCGLTALLGIVVVLIGVRRTVRGIARDADRRRLREQGVSTTGTVVDNRMSSTGQTGRHALTFAPVVRFELAGDAGAGRTGGEVVVVGDQRSHRSFVTGRPAEVLYDPADPQAAHVRAEGGAGPGATVSGIVVVVLGVLFLAGLARVAGEAFALF